jgi:hypothetical protein
MQLYITMQYYLFINLCIYKISCVLMRHYKVVVGVKLNKRDIYNGTDCPFEI